MSSDPAAGAPVALAPTDANVDAARNNRVPFALLAAVAIVGAAAAGHPVEAALVAVVLVLGRALQRRWLAHTPSSARDARDLRPEAQTPDLAATSYAERALSLFGAWFTPIAIAASAAVLMRSGDVALALTLLLVASPQALFALPPSSRIAWRALAASAAAVLLGATLAGLVGLVAAALLHQASTVAAHAFAGARS